MTDNQHTQATDDQGPVTDPAGSETVEQTDLVEPDAEHPSAELLGLSLPSEPDEAIALLLRELNEARSESADLLDNVQRIAADFDNYRKRIDRDRIENVQRAGQRVIESLLPALDSLDAALTIDATSDSEVGMLEGMRATQTLLLDALSNEGCEGIDAVGKPFDPALHEAVSVLPGEGEQVVDQELRKGYTMQGRVIRPSLVIVGHA